MNNGDLYINLKELRDQILRRRCSNGHLLMWGIANDGRLGLDFKELDPKNSINLGKDPN